MNSRNAANTGTFRNDMSPPETNNHTSDGDDYFGDNSYTTSPPKSGGSNNYSFPRHDKEWSTPRSFRVENGDRRDDKKCNERKRRQGSLV